MGELKQEVCFRPGFDRRQDESGKNYGINGGMFLFVVSGPEGAISFSISPNFFPKSALDHIASVNRNNAAECFKYWGPRGVYVCCHALTPQYEDHEISDGPCDWLEGKQHCYCDGSYTRADEWMDEFMIKGTKWLWPALEAEYAEQFLASQEGDTE